jgi:hypothetical protein
MFWDYTWAEEQRRNKMISAVIEKISKKDIP